MPLMKARPRPGSTGLTSWIAALGIGSLQPKAGLRVVTQVCTMSRKPTWQLGEWFFGDEGEVCVAHFSVCYSYLPRVFCFYDYLIFA